jgi:hypothetical protein
VAVAECDEMSQTHSDGSLEVVVDETGTGRLLRVAEHHEWKAQFSQQVDPPVTQLHPHQDGAVALARAVEVEQRAIVERTHDEIQPVVTLFARRCDAGDEVQIDVARVRVGVRKEQ